MDPFKGDTLDNLFQGGGGKDTATGGGGRDLYDFNAVADSKAGSTTRDVITDFAHLTGPGEVSYFTSDSNTIIRASNDGDAASEFEVQLNGSVTLSAVDFFF